MSQENVETVRRIYDAYAGRDNTPGCGVVEKQSNHAIWETCPVGMGTRGGLLRCAYEIMASGE